MFVDPFNSGSVSKASSRVWAVSCVHRGSVAELSFDKRGASRKCLP